MTMTNIEKLNALKPEKPPRKGLTKEELVAIKAARDRGCTWKEIWQAADWPYKNQGSFLTSAMLNKNWPREKI